MEKRKLEGQVAIITGSSSGIGAGCAMEMAKAGATVIVNYPVPGARDMAEQVVNDKDGITLGSRESELGDHAGVRGGPGLQGGHLVFLLRDSASEMRFATLPESNSYAA